MAKAYIKLYYDFTELTEALTDAERSRLVIAMLEYARSGEVPEDALEGNERILFPTFRRQIDRDSTAYDSQVRQNTANGKKGGRPRRAAKTENNPTDDSETEKSQDKDKDKEKDKDKDKEKDEDKDKDSVCEIAGAAAPHAPTQDAIVDYCRERKLRINPQAFWNYYQANGWRAGGHPIRDWQAKLREWDARESAGTSLRPQSPRAAPANPALNYAQRDYADDDHYFVDLDAYGEN